MHDVEARGEHRRAGPLVAAVLLVSCARSIPPADPQFVAAWMRNYCGLIRAERISPPVAARVLAYAISGAVRVDSRDLGKRIGTAILAWSARDGFTESRTRPYHPPVGPQFWVNDSRVNEYTAQNLTAVSDFVTLDNPAATLRCVGRMVLERLHTRETPAR